MGCEEGRKEETGTCALLGVMQKAARAPLQTCAGNNKGIIYLFRSVPSWLASCMLACLRHFRRSQMLMPTHLNVVSLCPVHCCIATRLLPSPPFAPELNESKVPPSTSEGFTLHFSALFISSICQPTSDWVAVELEPGERQKG